MTVNFEKLSSVVTFMVFFVILYEAIKWKAFESGKWTLITTFLVASSGLLFSGYYIPSIVEMQSSGELLTASEVFKNTHFASELNFKIFAFSTVTLLVMNLKKIIR